MYEELYNVWKKEVASRELDELPRDFVSRIAEYLKKLAEEHRMLDKKTAKAHLLKIEEQNVKRMLSDLARIRYRKLVAKAADDIKLLASLTEVKEEDFLKLLSLTESYQSFVKSTFKEPAANSKVSHKMVVLRFLGEIPEIVGLDMKIYGPYKPQDVASIPVENAKILIKQGLAEKVEIS
ncbi:MAG: hypothetical protein RMJ15_06190 [Nitrososphaerota archaeon]|nr:hypothetical protein [Candidatus Bathyarchaeota archaeon]MDW8023307.1 hypothetical protein [Nitrososphaerota archaeon]